jgi:hypothetical protein
MSTHQIIQGLVVTVNRKLDETSGFLLLSLFVLRRYWRRAGPLDDQRPLVNDRVQRVRLAPLRVGRCSCRGLHAALPSN